MQKSFKEQAQSLVEAIKEMGNPFLHDSAELILLNTRDILSETVVATACPLFGVWRNWVQIS